MKAIFGTIGLCLGQQRVSALPRRAGWDAPYAGESRKRRPSSPTIDLRQIWFGGPLTLMRRSVAVAATCPHSRSARCRPIARCSALTLVSAVRCWNRSSHPSTRRPAGKSPKVSQFGYRFACDPELSVLNLKAIVNISHSGELMQSNPATGSDATASSNRRTTWERPALRRLATSEAENGTHNGAADASKVDHSMS
jgi:hypothetical protein